MSEERNEIERAEGASWRARWGESIWLNLLAAIIFFLVIEPLAGSVRRSLSTAGGSVISEHVDTIYSIGAHDPNGFVLYQLFGILVSIYLFIALMSMTFAWIYFRKENDKPGVYRELGINSKNERKFAKIAHRINDIFRIITLAAMVFAVGLTYWDVKTVRRLHNAYEINLAAMSAVITTEERASIEAQAAQINSKKSYDLVMARMTTLMRLRGVAVPVHPGV